MVSETKGSFVRWLANLNIKRNLTSMFVNKYPPYMTLNVAVKLESCTSCVNHCLQAGISRFMLYSKKLVHCCIGFVINGSNSCSVGKTGP